MNPKIAVTAAPAGNTFFPILANLEANLPEAGRPEPYCNLNAAGDWLNELMKAARP